MTSKKKIQASMGELRSIEGTMKMLQTRLKTIVRENDLSESATALNYLDEAIDELGYLIFGYEALLHKD